MDISQRIAQYASHYDVYFEERRSSHGRHEQRAEHDDPLMSFVEEVIDNNLQHPDDSGDTWNDLLKDYAMGFVGSMLQKYIPIEQQHKQEEDYLEKFERAATDIKVKMIPALRAGLRRYYTAVELNFEGYLAQINDSNVEIVAEALVSDWRKALKRRVSKAKHDLVAVHKKGWADQVMVQGKVDFEVRRRVDTYFIDYPQLNDIIRVIGREQPTRTEPTDDYLTEYRPILPSVPIPAAEAEEIMQGDNLRHMIPIEKVIMADEATEVLFYHRYASRELQLYAHRPKMVAAVKTITRKEKPRLEKGPIIVALDTSGSMCGSPLEIARGLIFKLVNIARCQGRKCFLIMFSVRARCVDLTTIHSWRELHDFMQIFFTGGTDGEQMLSEAIKALGGKDYSMADVLIISDFHFGLPCYKTEQKMKHEQTKGTRFYGLAIGRSRTEYSRILDNVWTLRKRSANRATR